MSLRILAFCGSLRRASMNVALPRGLGLSEDATVASAHAPAIRAALARLGASA